MGKDSGGLEDDTKNQRLENEIAAQSERGVVVLPTAFVNTAAIRGQLSSASVFTAICAGYSEGTRPAICDKCSGCADAVTCVTKGGRCPAGGNSGTASGQVSSNTF